MLRYESRAGGGPMQTASSARSTASVSASIVEYTATVGMPSSRAVRMILTAFSPRLATSSFTAPASRLQLEQQLPELGGRRVLQADGAHDAALLGHDLVEELHRLDQAERLARLDPLAHLDERRLVGRGAAGEGADHRAGVADQAVAGLRLAVGGRRGRP